MKQKRLSLLPLLALLSLLCSALIANAQSTAATLAGTVQDTTGAVVADVKITILNNATSLKRTAVTNRDGYFSIPMLPPGTYSLAALRDGFAPVAIKDIVLNTNDRRELQIKLKVASASESLTVEASSSAIDTSAAVATVVGRRFVENMPLNGRTLQSLITLTPGTVTASGEGGQFSANGQRTNSNYFTIDGVAANIAASQLILTQEVSGSIPGFNAMGTTNNLVSVDALEEFKIQTSGYAPEFGRSAGAQVQMTTRSGTNAFHGTLSEYFRNEALDANDWFLNHSHLKRTPLRQNDFGATLGGPIRKDRTFFFFSYEGVRIMFPRVNLTARVPSLSLRQAVIPELKPFFDAFPIPATTVEDKNRTSPFPYAYSNPSHLDAVSLKIDHTINSKLTVFGRYNYSPSGSKGRTLAVVNPVDMNTQTLTLGTTWLMSSTISNETRLNYSRNRTQAYYYLDDFGGAVPVPDNILFPAGHDRRNARFYFTAPGYASYNTGWSSENIQRQFNILDNLSMMRGRHSLKFGFDYRYLQPKAGPLGYDEMVYFNDLAQLLAPRPTARSITVKAKDTLNIIQKNVSLYAQDQWRATSRLTFDFGVRWDVNPAPHAKEDPGLMTLKGIDNPATMSLAPKGTPLYNTIYRGFAPRASASYAVGQKSGWETVLRGGYGLFYDLGAGSVLGGYTYFPHDRSVTRLKVPFPFDAASVAPPAPLNLDGPYKGVQFMAVDPEYTLPRTHEWNVAVEQSIAKTQTLTVSYVANAGRRLLRRYLLRPEPTNTKFIQCISLITGNREGNADTSDYNSLQVQFQRRSRTVQVLANYTWAHAIDTNSNDGNILNRADYYPPQGDRASSGFDRRHAVNVAVTWDLPYVRNGNRILRATTHGWSVDTIFKAQSAAPINISATQYTPDGSFVFRPDAPAPGAQIWIKDPTAGGGKRIDPTIFFIPDGREGTLTRNGIRGFGSSQLDLSIRREFALTEGFKLQLKGELFNAPNHPNFMNPYGNLATVYSTSTPRQIDYDPGFGVSPSMLNRGLGGMSALYQVGGPRSVQLALKLMF